MYQQLKHLTRIKMKTVLIPTDFQLESLKVIDALIMANPGQQFKIVLFHVFKVSDSITDLLMLSRRSRDYEQISDDFYFELENYKKRYEGQLTNIEISYFYGTTVAAFRNFTDNINLDLIAFSSAYEFQAINKYSLNPTNLIERAKLVVVDLNTTYVTEPENLFESKIPADAQEELIPNF